MTVMKASFGKAILLLSIIGISIGLLVFGLTKINTQDNKSEETNETTSEYLNGVS